VTRASGAVLALVAALFYGASFPLAKALLNRDLPPLILAGGFYLAQAVVFGAIRLVHRAPIDQRITRGDLKWLAGAILSGGILAPGLYFYGQKLVAAHVGSLLATTEIIFTTAIALWFFKERLSRREAVSFLLIISGGVAVALGGERGEGSMWGAPLVVAGFLMWGLDNNFTTRIAHRDPLQISMLKGLVGGLANLALWWAFANEEPPALDAGMIAAIGAVGAICFGLSLTLFIYSMRSIGASRSAALFGTNPAFAVVLSFALLAETPNGWAIAGGIFVTAGVASYLTRKVKPGAERTPG